MFVWTELKVKMEHKKPNSSSHLDIPKNDNGTIPKMGGGLFHLRNSAC